MEGSEGHAALVGVIGGVLGMLQLGGVLTVVIGGTDLLTRMFCDLAV